MGDVESMKILDCVEDLVENPSSCPLFEANLCGHYSEEFSLFCKLSDNVDMVCGLNDLVEVDNVRMPDLFHDLYLPLDSQLVVFVLNRLLVNNFDGHLLSSRYMNPLLDLPERPPSESLPHLVVSYSSWQLLPSSSFLHFLLNFNMLLVRVQRFVHA